VTIPTSLIVLLIIAIVVASFYRFARLRGWIERPAAGGAARSDDELSGRMSLSDRVTIIVYLFVLGLVMVFMEISLLSLDFPDTPPAFTPTELQPAVASSQTPKSPTDVNLTPPASPTPVIDDVRPPSVIGSSPDMWLTVHGKNFSDKSQVTLNGTPVLSQYHDSSKIFGKFSSEDLSSGSLTVRIAEGAITSNSALITVSPRKPKVPLNVLLLWKPWINREVQLLLIIVFAGTLGSYIHAIKSATAFIGNGSMKSSWFWWYISGPLVGMAMALIFYAVLRGGFLAGTPADEKVVNPFGVLVVGALVGMFSDKASLKLGEIFDTLFKSGDPRSDKLEAPVITSLNPDTVRAGQASQLIKIIGERLGKVSVVRFNSTEVAAEVLSDREVQFTLEATHLETPRTLQVVAVDPQSGASISAALKIEGAQITAPETLAAATLNTPYTQTIEGVSVPPPSRWSLGSGAPGWLSIDAATGQLSGTPTAVGDFQITVRLENGSGQSNEKTYVLTVN
jgi:hypothetical protein